MAIRSPRRRPDGRWDSGVPARFVEAMRKNGNEARWSTPAELGEFTAQRSRMRGDLIRKMNVRAE